MDSIDIWIGRSVSKLIKAACSNLHRNTRCWFTGLFRPRSPLLLLPASSTTSSSASRWSSWTVGAFLDDLMTIDAAGGRPRCTDYSARGNTAHNVGLIEVTASIWMQIIFVCFGARGSGKFSSLADPLRKRSQYVPLTDGAGGAAEGHSLHSCRPGAPKPAESEFLFRCYPDPSTGGVAGALPPGANALAALACQSARNFDPVSARNNDPGF